MSRLIAALLVLAIAGPETLAAQATTTLAPGARVRITSAGSQPRIGTVVSGTADTLRVRWPQVANDVAIPVAAMSRLEVSTGRHRRVAKGAGLGVLAGGATGVLVGALSYKPCDSTEFLGCFLEPRSRTQAASWGGLAGGALGLVVGSLAGLARHESWQRLSLDERRVGLAVTPGAQATRIGLSLQY